MKENLKSERGAITLIVLVTMIFLLTFLIVTYIKIANKAQTSAEITKQIAERYNNIGDAEDIYSTYSADDELIPIYTVDQLKKIGSGKQVSINGKTYTFASDGIYILQNDLNLGGKYDEATKTWTGTEWEPLPLTDENGKTYEFTGILDGLGHKITGLYINKENSTNQGLFGTLDGTAKNIKVSDSYIKAKEYAGSIAGKNNGTIQNCYNDGQVIGTNNIGGIAGKLEGTIQKCYNSGTIIGDTNVTGGHFESITTGEILNIWNSETISENAKFVSGKNTAIVPKGFRVSLDVYEQTIKDGMVVLDSDKNEFVWVPVIVAGTTDAEKEANFENIRTDGYITDKLQTLVKNKVATEPFAKGYTDEKGTEETKDYQEMRTSVIKNEGFYIGRYEAGVEGDTPRKNIENGTSKMVVQRDKFPYNFVGWGLSMSDYESDVIWQDKNQGKGALYLSKHMYDGKDVGVVSTLCYGAQWDATLVFMEDESYIRKSTSIGNYLDNLWTITRKTAKTTSDYGVTWKAISEETNKMKIKTTNANILLTTGASENFKCKNIYDFAGNVFEWTNEADASCHISRGGHANGNGADYPSSVRNSYGNTCNCGLFSGFRPALYIK